MVVTFYHYETVPLAPVVETFLGRVAVSMLWHWGEYFPSGPQWDLRHIAYDVIGK
jgi:hypothetical protein